MEGRIDSKYYTGYLSGAADGLNQGRKDTIAKLEKIKKKLILKLSEKFDFWITEALNIIDEELSELKGENNG